MESEIIDCVINNLAENPNYNYLSDFFLILYDLESNCKLLKSLVKSRFFVLNNITDDKNTFNNTHFNNTYQKIIDNINKLSIYFIINKHWENLEKIINIKDTNLQLSCLSELLDFQIIELYKL